MTPDLPRVLAFDTSSQVTSVAVCHGAQLLAADHAHTEARHAEVLLPKIQRCLTEAGLELSDVDVIGVGAGPGSFTGVRVGVSTAKGLGLALQRPVIAIGSLEALAYDALPTLSSPWVAACLDAYKGELFAALYERSGAGLRLALAPFHGAPRSVGEQLTAAVCGSELALIGAGVARYPALFEGLPGPVQRFETQWSEPSARSVAVLAAAAFARGEILPLGQVAPVYLRGSDAQLPKTPLRV
jgi:tRNA threonylcarbamoyladenosine biosynthesis protein TsaB